MIDWHHYESWLREELISKPALIHLKAPEPGLLNTDTRNISPQEWFLPLKGSSFDGHSFLGAAFQKKIQGAFCEEASLPLVPEEFRDRLMVVKDSLKSLGLIAKGFRSLHPQVKIASLTGSVGKTTARQMLTCILKLTGDTLSPTKNYNNEIGVPLTILKMTGKETYGVLEMGARRVGDIQYLTEIAQADVSACLIVRNVHLEEFGSQENIYRGKLEIFKCSAPSCVLVPTADDERILKTALEMKDRHVISFGYSPKAQVRVLGAQFHAGKHEVRIQSGSKTHTLRSSFYHEAAPYNMAAAFALALGLGVSEEIILKGLESFLPESGRFHIEEHPLGGAIIDDTYNASPESIRSGLVSLKQIYPDRPCLVILGDMKELGDETLRLHREIGDFCGQAIEPSFLMTAGPLAKNISEGFGKPHKSLHFESTDNLIKTQFEDTQNFQNLLDQFKIKPVVYLKASRSMGFDRIIPYLRDCFSRNIS